MKTKTLKTRLATIIMVCMMVVTAIASTSITASAATWRTGRFDGNNNTSAITVRLTNTSKNAKIKIHTYGKLESTGLPTKHKERSCSLYVTMRNTNGGWIWGGDITTGGSGKTMKLGCDHSVYRIYLRHPRTVHCWDFIHCCPTEWAVECTSNCSVN